MSDEHQFKGQHVVKTVGADAPEPAAAPPAQAQPGSPAHAADKNLALPGQPPRPARRESVSYAGGDTLRGAVHHLTRAGMRAVLQAGGSVLLPGGGGIVERLDQLPSEEELKAHARAAVHGARAMSWADDPSKTDEQREAAIRLAEESHAALLAETKKREEAERRNAELRKAMDEAGAGHVPADEHAATVAELEQTRRRVAELEAQHGKKR
jgi:hypothetical protein